jgi:hypothetical protein
MCYTITICSIVNKFIHSHSRSGTFFRSVQERQSYCRYIYSYLYVREVGPPTLSYRIQTFTNILELIWNYLEPSFHNLELHPFPVKKNFRLEGNNFTQPPPHFVLSTSNLYQYFGTNLELFGTKFSEFGTSPFSRKKDFRFKFLV